MLQKIWKKIKDNELHKCKDLLFPLKKHFFKKWLWVLVTIPNFKWNTQQEITIYGEAYILWFNKS